MISEKRKSQKNEFSMTPLGGKTPTYVSVSVSACLFVCVSVCVHVVVYVCVCVCLRVFVCQCLCMSICPCVSMSVCAHGHVCLCMSVCLSGSVSVYVCVCVCVHRGRAEGKATGYFTYKESLLNYFNLLPRDCVHTLYMKFFCFN